MDCCANFNGSCFVAAMAIVFVTIMIVVPLYEFITGDKTGMNDG